MRQVEVQIVQAFAHQGEGGNPAGVVLDADGLTAADKQAIAQQVGLPETAFVSRSSVAEIKLDFFTPTRQIAHCGHATIATFSLLRQLGRLRSDESSKETIDGVRRILMKGDLAFMQQSAPRAEALPASVPIARLARSLGIAESVLATAGDAPCVLSTGNRFLLASLPDAQALAALQPEFAEIHRISDELDLIGCYVYTLQSNAETLATTRMFAPRYGIAEEAGTGMAAGPLACRLWELGHARAPRVLLEQGRFMTPASVSRLIVDLEIRDGRIESLFAGGQAYAARVLTISLPPAAITS